MSDAERVLRTYAETFGRGDVDSLAAMYAARTDYQTARTELERATGSLIENRDIDISTTSQ